MRNSINLLKSGNFAMIFVVCHIVSFFSLFISYSSGAIISGILIATLVVHYRLVITQLYQGENFFFLLLIFFQLCSFSSYFFVPESRDFFLKNPSIFLETISYLFIPQIAFYFFGYYIGKSSKEKANAFKIIIVANLIFAILSLFLHFLRPGFFTAFLARSVATGDDFEFYPRLTGYLNSMIVGILCSSCLVLSMKYLNSISIKFISFIAFSLCVVFSLQRGAWASMAIGLSLFFIIAFFHRPILTVIRTVKYAFVLFLLGVFIVFGLSMTRFDILGSQLLETINTDMLNKIASFSEAASERADQKDSFFTLIKSYPLGIGFGLLSHKSADLGFVYAIPDGNYYRIGGELGVFGLISFLFIIVIAVIKLYYKKEYTIIIVILLYCLQAYGTNVFDLYMCGFLFWFLLGISFSVASNDTN